MAAAWSAWTVAGLRSDAHFAGRMQGFSRIRWRVRSSTSCTSGPSQAEGTFDAAIEKLDSLVELGVTHVELMPVAAFAGDYGWGYDGVALYAVHEPYGGPDGVEAVCERDPRAGGSPCCSMWSTTTLGRSGNYAGKFGPYLIDAHKTPWGGAVNLEGAGADEVRRFFCDNALMWLRDFHIDGLRLDAVHAFVDRSAIHFLEQLVG